MDTMERVQDVFCNAIRYLAVVEQRVKMYLAYIRMSAISI